MKHNLKTLPAYFQPIWSGRKTFTIRNNDRKFSVDDEVVFDECDELCEYSGRYVQAFITYLTAFEQKPDYVVFGFREFARYEE